MLAVAADPEVEEEYVSGVMEILSDAGRVERLAENLMDQFTVVSGCSPAFVYMFIEALADGGVMTGLPRAQAMTYAAQTVMGAAAMVLEIGKHPENLKMRYVLRQVLRSWSGETGGKRIPLRGN